MKDAGKKSFENLIGFISTPRVAIKIRPITALRLCSHLFFSSLGVLGDSVVKKSCT
jgi:hypothetical protein